MTLIEEMEMYAHEHDVPIMQKEGIDFMCSFLKEHNLKHVLEIGSAIGYSAIRMAMLDMDIQITTIERDKDRYDQAVEYVKRSGLQDRITLLFGDALETVVEGSFDMLFIDAAKAQYIYFLPQVLRLMPPGGLLVSDNVLQDGDVLESRFAVTRRNRTIHARMREYLSELTHHPGLETCILPVGDGVTLSVKHI